MGKMKIGGGARLWFIGALEYLYQGRNDARVNEQCDDARERMTGFVTTKCGLEYKGSIIHKYVSTAQISRFASYLKSRDWWQMVKIVSHLTRPLWFRCYCFRSDFPIIHMLSLSWVFIVVLLLLMEMKSGSDGSINSNSLTFNNHGTEHMNLYFLSSLHQSNTDSP
jgi:hypothetical protein